MSSELTIIIKKGHLIIKLSENGFINVCDLENVKFSKLKQTIVNALGESLISNQDFMEHLEHKVLDYYWNRTSNIFNQLIYNDDSSEDDSLNSLNSSDCPVS